MEKEIEFKKKVMDFITEIIDKKEIEKSPAMLSAIAELISSIN